MSALHDLFRLRIYVIFIFVYMCICTYVINVDCRMWKRKGRGYIYIRCQYIGILVMGDASDFMEYDRRTLEL